MKIFKKIFFVFLATCLIALCACNSKRVDSIDDGRDETSRFIKIEYSISLCSKIVADKYTGVMYSVSTGAYNGGNFTLLVNADGKPLIWDFEKGIAE